MILNLAVKDEMSIEEILYDCCKLRHNPPELIHRTIHEFNWFFQKLVFNRSEIIFDKYMPINDQELSKKITEFKYPEDEQKILKEVIKLFHEYCKEVYNNVDYDTLDLNKL